MVHVARHESLLLAGARKIHSDIVPTPSLNYIGGVKMRNLASIFNPVAFDGLWLRNGELIGNPMYLS